MFNFAYVIIRNATSHNSQGCNNLIRITWEDVITCAVLHGGGSVIWISQLFCLFFGKQNFSSEIHVFWSDQFSLLMHCCLLPSSVTVKMDYEENMENARCATNDDTPL